MKHGHGSDSLTSTWFVWKISSHTLCWIQTCSIPSTRTTVWFPPCFCAWVIPPHQIWGTFYFTTSPFSSIPPFFEILPSIQDSVQTSPRYFQKGNAMNFVYNQPRKTNTLYLYVWGIVWCSSPWQISIQAKSQRQWYWTCDPGTCIFCITWELVRE